MRFRLLGPLEYRAGDDDWRGIGAPKWRSVLAALLINAGQIVPADVLISTANPWLQMTGGVNLKIILRPQGEFVHEELQRHLLASTPD